VTGEFVNDRYLRDAAEAHDAITITPNPVDTGLDETTLKIYVMIAQRTLALTYPAARYIDWEAITTDAGVEFVTKGQTLIEDGYHKILPCDPPGTTAFEDLTPRTKVKARYFVEETTAAPPARFTEASLVEAMKNSTPPTSEGKASARGIGTPLDRSDIVLTLSKNGYISVDRDNGDTITMTEKGKAVIESIDNDELLSPSITAEWEEALARIEQMPAGSTARAIIDEVLVFHSKLEDKVRSWLSG
jgi:DNA topoisomerase-3